MTVLEPSLYSCLTYSAAAALMCCHNGPRDDIMYTHSMHACQGLLTIDKVAQQLAQATHANALRGMSVATSLWSIFLVAAPATCLW